MKADSKGLKMRNGAAEKEHIMTITFPRLTDRKGHAWGLQGPSPQKVWERFSPAYETQLKRLIDALVMAGFRAEIGGAGSEDGEYVHAAHPDGRTIFQHMEDPDEARFLAAMDDTALGRFVQRGTLG